MKLAGGTWDVIEPLDADAGAYAQLYVVKSVAEDGVEAVAKCVLKRPGAQRELLLGDSIRAAEYSNVMPVIDSGEHGDHLVIVMPLATMSLRQYLDQQPGGIPLRDALDVLDDIAVALAEIDGEIIHRDIKPANILKHEGRWKLADFGISRYAEAVTATQTRRESFTYEYAAPEQWNHQPTTSRTDVYAFGVLAFELLEGRIPFQGPNFRDQHLTMPPPEMLFGTPKTRHLIVQCLLKDPETRPDPGSLQKRLHAAEIDATKQGTTKLATLSARRMERVSAEQARLAAERAEEERLQTVARGASELLRPVARAIKAELKETASEIEFDSVSGNAAPIFRAKYDRALLEFERVDSVEYSDVEFTVYAYSSITVETGKVGDEWHGRSHSLWYCDAEEQGRFAWYELAFSAPTDARQPRIEPFASPPWSPLPNFADVVRGAGLAWPMTELDLAEPSEFIQRWIGWFADAADGSLTRPSTLPGVPPTV